MASVWKGSISFGLVNIPIRLYPAVRPGEGDLHFRQLHSRDLAPIRYERVCTADGEEVPWSEVVKGYEYAKGKYVALTDAEVKAAAMETSETIEMLDFVKEQEIDPRFFDTPYYVVPVKGGEKAYALFREAIHATGMVGIGKFTLRQKQQLASVKAVGDALVLEVMRFADHLVDPSEYSFPREANVRQQELAMAQQLVQNLSTPFDPSKYSDDYRDKLMRVIRAKLKGKKIEVPETRPAADTKVLDLMAKLRASLENGKAAAATAAAEGSNAKRASRAKSRNGTPRAGRKRKSA
jgi:DNA end-binding protein Ku